MGADIYLNSRFKKARDEWEPKFHAACAERDKHPRDSAEAERLQQEIDRCYEAMYPDDGYFRDSYNSTSLFWVLGLSWWDLSSKLLNKKGELTITKAKALLKRFETGDAAWSDEKFDTWVEEQREKHKAGDFCATIDDGDNSPEVWRNYFKEKHEHWIRLLKLSIELKEPLFWST